VKKRQRKVYLGQLRRLLAVQPRKFQVDVIGIAITNLATVQFDQVLAPTRVISSLCKDMFGGYPSTEMLDKFALGGLKWAVDA
jgi:hypothetical protein